MIDDEDDVTVVADGEVSEEPTIWPNTMSVIEKRHLRQQKHKLTKKNYNNFANLNKIKKIGSSIIIKSI